ncbi:MAG: hypothetical protein GXY85_05605 [Candidatus Brocadiaceae bacterium]|nr:hypothetical protein [Candidatus Brocadiaceae bacterium]
MRRTDGMKALRAGKLLALLPLLVAASCCLTLASPRPAVRRTLVLNPYAGVDWDTVGHHRANLHAHTTRSDGTMEPQAVIDEYHKAGYTILALTDHSRCTYPWEDLGRSPDELGMVAVPGNELSRHHHTGSFFCTLETDETDLDAALQAVADHGGLAVLFHPGRYWRPDLLAEPVPAAVRNDYLGYLRRHDHLLGIEVFNQRDRYPWDRLLWDALLAECMPDRPVWGFADDDMHSMSTFGYGRNVFLLDEASLDAVRRAMVGGAFYFNHGTEPDRLPVLTRVAHDEEAGTLEVTGEVAGEPLARTAYRWVSDGRPVQVGPRLCYRTVPGLGGYVRVELIGPGGTTYVNPFGLGGR